MPAPGEVLRTTREPFLAAETAAALGKIAGWLRGIAELSARYGLSPEWCSLRRTLVASLSITWADLQNAKAAALAAYGEADARLRSDLDPLIDLIAQHIATPNELENTESGWRVRLLNSTVHLEGGKSMGPTTRIRRGRPTPPHS